MQPSLLLKLAAVSLSLAACAAPPFGDDAAPGQAEELTVAAPATCEVQTLFFEAGLAADLAAAVDPGLVRTLERPGPKGGTISWRVVDVPRALRAELDADIVSGIVGFDVFQEQAEDGSGSLVASVHGGPSPFLPGRDAGGALEARKAAAAKALFDAMTRVETRVEHGSGLFGATITRRVRTSSGGRVTCASSQVDGSPAAPQLVCTLTRLAGSAIESFPASPEITCPGT